MHLELNMSRMDWKTAVIVNDGIAILANQGAPFAAEFLKQARVPWNVIDRVLAPNGKRRGQKRPRDGSGDGQNDGRGWLMAMHAEK
jgi:hypothetical protein